MYSVSEMTDMHYMYGLVDGNVEAALELYAERYAGRQLLLCKNICTTPPTLARDMSNKSHQPKMKEMEKNGIGEFPKQRNSPEIRKRSMLGNMKNYLMEYCRNTTIHGLKYLGEEHRPLAERICWLVAFLLSLAACGHLIRQVWNKWDQRPVIVSFAEQSTPLWQVPFPAITICSETKTQRDVVNFTQLLLKSAGPMTPEERSHLAQMSLLCDLQHYRIGDKFVNDSVIHFYQKVGPQFKNVLHTVKWKSKIVPPASLFSPLLTEEGVCYTFNMLEASEMFTQEYHNAGDFLNHGNSSPEWSLDEGYAPDAGVDVYPIRALGSGAKAGITLVMSAYSNDLDYLCMGPVQGFKVLLHNPAEMPRVREQYLRVPLNQELVVRVIPTMMTTSEGLRGYSPHRRQCYFPSERHLRFFKVYTQSNCALECLTNFTMHQCKCVAFYMPRDNRSMPICGSGNIDCINKARDLLLTREVEQGMLQQDSQGKSLSDCDCLQACTVLDYEAETSQADLDWRVFLPVKSLNLAASSGLNIARLSVSFKDMQFIMSRRSELYGQTDFLANCGGLLGLFMGFSILSLIEIVYYLTLRICCVYHWSKNNIQLLHNY